MPVKLEDHPFRMEEKFWPSWSCPSRRVLVKDEIASALDKAPRWSHVALEEHRVPELSEGAAVMHDGRAWKLAFHQQTPVAA